jgi:F-type H+-transporting ATPase subunit gamma
MAQQSREIKRRIRSVKNTQQITRAMKMVAAAKLRRAQTSMMAMRPYADRLAETLRHVAVDLVGDEHPFFRPREPRRTLTVVVAGDRGLCGGFNSQILRKAAEHLDGMPDREHVLFAIGKRAVQGLRKRTEPIRQSYIDVFGELSYVLAGDVCDRAVHLYMAKKDATRIDEAYIVYNEFVNRISQKPRVKKLLPLDFAEIRGAVPAPEKDAETGARPVFEIEPDPESALRRLVSRRLATEVFRALLESYAAELAARMTAMDNATNNAEDMIDRLTMEYNRARQAGITSELLDIVGGANALA